MNQKQPIMYVKCLLIILVLLPLSMLKANAWRLNVTAKPIPTGSGPQMYEYTIKIEDWDFNSELPNPLYNCTTKHPSGNCHISIGYHRKNSAGSGIYDSIVKRSPTVSSAKTIGELGRGLSSNLSWWYTKSHKINLNNSQVCFHVGYHINGGLSNVVMPNGHCTYANLPPTICSISEPYIELVHVAKENEIEGNIATGQLHLTCTDKMKIRVVGKYKYDEILLDKESDFKSIITINNNPLSIGTVINASPQDTLINIKSELKGRPPTGEYQGSTVIIVAPE